MLFYKNADFYYLNQIFKVKIQVLLLFLDKYLLGQSRCHIHYTKQVLNSVHNSVVTCY